MNSKFSVTKSMVVAVALAAGISGVARADDNSLSRFGGDGYAYFNAAESIVSKAPSAFRQNNPNGLSNSQYQALSSEGSAWQPSPVIDRTLATFRQTNPRGLSESQYQALSSEGPAWHSTPRLQTNAVASRNATVVTNTAAK